jgi:hypothetical protein
MSFIFERVSGDFTNLFGADMRDTVNNLGSGAVLFARGTSRCLADLIDIRNDGISKTLKAAIATLNTATWFYGLPESKYKFAVKAMSDQKDFFYALKFIDTLALIFNPNRRGPVSLKDKLLGVANFLDTARYLQKHKVLSFEVISKLGTKIGNARVFVGTKLENGVVFAYSSRFEDIPLLGNIVSKPKEIFVFAASIIELKEVKNNWNGQIEGYLKLVATVGKMTILSLSNTPLGKIKAFVLVDFVTQNAGLIKHLIECKKNRDRLLQPVRVPVRF